MRRSVAVTAVLCALAAGCSSGEAGSKPVDTGAPIDSSLPPVDSNAQSIAAGPLELEGGASIRSLPISTNDLMFDQTRGVLYATTGDPYVHNPGGGVFDAGAGADPGNNVLTIDPASATVTGVLPVGGLPTVLAISDDRSALYVGVQVPATDTPVADTVRRVDLASMTVGPLVSSPGTVGQIAAVPGSSTRYVVLLSFAGLALYDGTTLLNKMSYSMEADSITFTDPSTLFGCSLHLMPSELTRFSVTPTAITPGKSVTGLITNSEARITSNGGWIFASDGEVVSAATMASLGTYNAFPSGLPISRGAVLPDADGANVWFVQGYARALLDFDRTTFQLRRSISLDPVSADVDLRNASALVQWSPTGLAFRTNWAVYLVTVPK